MQMLYIYFFLNFPFIFKIAIASHSSANPIYFMTSLFYLKANTMIFLLFLGMWNATFLWFIYLNISKSPYTKYCQLLFTVNFQGIKQIKAGYI